MSDQTNDLPQNQHPKRPEQINRALFRISRALYRFPRLDRMLAYITNQVRALIRADGAMVILIDETRKDFFISAATFADRKTGQKMRGIRFPLDRGVAGQVYHTGKPMIVPQTDKNPFYYEGVDKEARYHSKNMLDVPLRIHNRMIGVLCAVNKREGGFDNADVNLLEGIANLVALPIENARINEALTRAYDNVQGLSRAKEQVIHHLSHELKTPLSVLAASFRLMEDRYRGEWDESLNRILARARRNLNRLLDVQYEISDMLRQKDYRSHGMLSFLLDASRDMLAVLAEAHPGCSRVPEVIQQAIDREFVPVEKTCSTITLDRWVTNQLAVYAQEFAYRHIRLDIHVGPVEPISIPEEVMEKIVKGVLRNAVQNTPDKGRVTVTVCGGEKGPVFEVCDTGVGITQEKQRLIFNHYFAAGETNAHASESPFDFNAGGKGRDLLRIAIFSERYRFDTKLDSKRCRFIPAESDPCPGDIDRCDHCSARSDCDGSGGTTVSIQFRSPAAGVSR